MEPVKDVIIEVLRQEGKPAPLNSLVDALVHEGYSKEEVERAIDELEQAGFIKKGKTATLYGEEPTIELIREPQMKLEELAEKEEITLTPSEKRTLETVEKVFGVEKPEIVEVDGTKTVIVEVHGERVNIAIGEVKRPEQFEPVALEGRVWYIKRSPALERLKEKLRGEGREERVSRPVAGVTEYGALKKYERYEELSGMVKRLRRLGW